MRSHEELALIAAIADDLAAGVWVATVPEGRFVYSNRAFAEIMGMDPVSEAAAGGYAEPYGIFGRDGEHYPEDKMPFVRALQARATVVVDDLVIHRRDGRRVFVRASAKPMFDAAGAMTHVAIAFFDITREVEAERAREEMERRLRHVVANAPIVLFALDRAGLITMIEGRALERMGTAQDFLGKSALTDFPQAPKIADSMLRALAGETTRYIVDIDGSSYDTQLTPLREAGEIIGAIGVSTDVTELRRAESQLAQAERLASVGMLAAGVAHEINNPMSYVLGSLELLTRAVADNRGSLPTEIAARMDDLLFDAREGAERVRDIVRDLRLFSRVDEQRPHPTDVRAPLQASLAMARNEIRHRARLVESLQEVPKVHADEGRLGQLFLNLVINAAHAIPEGSAAENEIRVTTRVEGDSVCVEIADTGVGIPREALPRIFDPFFTTKPAGLGTGLGLSICHAIVSGFGGRISVESEPGRGSTFRVLLPVSREIDASKTKRGVATPSKRRGAVLLVDDEPLILKTVAALLSREHDVTCESRAEGALQRIARGERFDVILCDLMMPQVTGMELYDRVLAVAPEQAAVMLFMSGGAFTQRARDFVDKRPHAVLEKPLDTRALVDRIRAIVG